MGADMGADMLMLFKIGRMRRRMTRSVLDGAVLDSTVLAALEGPALPKTAAKRAAAR